MTYSNCHDVCCDNCVEDSFELIDKLIKDIQLLASEVVRLRYSLSWFLPKHTGEMVRSESRSDLHGSYYGHRIYQDFISDYYDGVDPFENEMFCNHLDKLSKGEKSTDEFRSLTFWH
jgi:hypothetical protein